MPSSFALFFLLFSLLFQGNPIKNVGGLEKPIEAESEIREASERRLRRINCGAERRRRRISGPLPTKQPEIKPGGRVFLHILWSVKKSGEEMNVLLLHEEEGKRERKPSGSFSFTSKNVSKILSA